jgi:hypothetical protein
VRAAGDDMFIGRGGRDTCVGDAGADRFRSCEDIHDH